MAVATTTLMPGSNPLFGLNTLGGALSLQTKDGRGYAGSTLQATDLAPSTNLYVGYSEGSRAATSIELGCADPAARCKLPHAMAGDPAARSDRHVERRRLHGGQRQPHPGDRLPLRALERRPEVRVARTERGAPDLAAGPELDQRSLSLKHTTFLAAGAPARGWFGARLRF